ncbi:MAG TPA: PAS domain S-box protein [Proteobacteria bacterium]|nr:PAS domain S-box protein [Pseudomonadota bacterium]
MELHLLACGIDQPVPAELHRGGQTGFIGEVNSSGLYGAVNGGLPTFLGTVGIIRNISRRKKVEDELARYRQGLEEMVAEQTGRIQFLNEVLQGVRSVNQLIVREKDRDRLIQAVCRNLVRERGLRGAWIVLNDHLPKKVEGAQSGFDPDAFARFLGRAAEGENPVCCEGALTNDPATSCESCPLGGQYEKCAGMTLALRHKGRQYGCLGVLAPPEFVGDAQETSLPTEIAGDIAFALHGIEVEAERLRSEQTLRTIFDSAGDGILLAKVKSGRLVAGNEALCRMLGYSVTELHELSVSDFCPVDRLADFRARLAPSPRDKIVVMQDVQLKRKDGSFFSADINAVLVELDNRLHGVGIVRNITVRKNLEAQLHQA